MTNLARIIDFGHVALGSSHKKFGVWPGHWSVSKTQEDFLHYTIFFRRFIRELRDWRRYHHWRWSADIQFSRFRPRGLERKTSWYRELETRERWSCPSLQSDIQFTGQHKLHSNTGCPGWWLLGDVIHDKIQIGTQSTRLQKLFSGRKYIEIILCVYINSIRLLEWFYFTREIGSRLLHTTLQ